jgi:cytoskeletal protein CcmA (bactofilin family)
MAMFGNSSSNEKKEATKSKSGSSSASGGSHALNSIVQGTVVDGSVNSKSDFRVDGTIKGKLFCDAKVIIGPTGLVEGEIRCKNAMIEGKFEGILNVSEVLNIRESAKVSGDFTSNKLIVQSGAMVNGNCNMGGEKRTTVSDKKASNPSASKVGQPSKV